MFLATALIGPSACARSLYVDDVGTQIDYEAPQYVRDQIAALGRTEDIKFSLNNKRLAVAGFVRNTIAVFEISIVASGDSKNIRLTRAVEFRQVISSLPMELTLSTMKEFLLPTETERHVFSTSHQMRSDAVSWHLCRFCRQKTLLRRGQWQLSETRGENVRH